MPEFLNVEIDSTYDMPLTLTVTQIHPMTYGQGQGYCFLGHQS